MERIVSQIMTDMKKFMIQTMGKLHQKESELYEATNNLLKDTYSINYPMN